MQREETKCWVSGEVAKLIQTERKRKGWTVYKLAKSTGIPPCNISRIETGLVSPRIDTVNALCVALDIEIRLPFKF